MKKNIRHIIFILFSAIILHSCKEEISLDIPNSDPVLVIQGEITTEKDSSYVHLTKSVSYFTNDIIPTINNASVKVNGIIFKSKGNGIYKPDTPFTALVNTSYNLSVLYDGNEYTSSALLDQLFDVTRIDSVFQPGQQGPGSGGGGPGSGGPGGGGRKSGYAVRFWWTDYRLPGKYTYIRYGKSNSEILQDSFFRNIVLLDNSQTKLNTELSTEVGRRFQPGDTVTIIFKSCDYSMFNFFRAYQTQTSSPPGPFQVPAANLPTNIRGGAVGYFTASDVRRYRKPL